MDIAYPRLEDQAAPAPWRATRRNCNKLHLIHKVLERNEDASADEIVAELAAKNVPVSGILVAREIQKMRESKNAPVYLSELEQDARD
jgi:ribosomal protein L14E/L6E/L27E